MTESKELKSLLMKVKESEKVDLKLNIQKTKIMASGPTTSWQIDGETVKTALRLTVQNFEEAQKNKSASWRTPPAMVAI